MNWKSIGLHALLLLAAGITFGIFEPHPGLADTKALLSSYLLTKVALHVVYAGILAHLTFKVEKHPVAHALLAVLLSQEAASLLLAILLSYMGTESYVQPPPLLFLEYIMLLASLVVGTAAGARLRRRKRLQSGTGGHVASA